MVPEGITAEFLTATDDDVVTTASLITDEEILEEVNEENTGEDVLDKQLVSLTAIQSSGLSSITKKDVDKVREQLHREQLNLKR